MSEEALADIIAFFLETCIDQVDFMESMVELDKLRARIQLWAEESIRLDVLPPKAGAELDALLCREMLPRGDVTEIVGTGDRQARRIVSALKASRRRSIVRMVTTKTSARMSSSSYSRCCASMATCPSSASSRTATPRTRRSITAYSTRSAGTCTNTVSAKTPSSTSPTRRWSPRPTWRGSGSAALHCPRLRATYNEHERVILDAIKAEAWEDPGRIAQTAPTKNRPGASYRVQDGSVKLYGKDYRAVVVHSSAHDQRRQKRLERELRTSREQMEQVAKAGAKKIFFCRPDSEAAAAEVRAYNSTYHQLDVRVEERPR